MLTNKRIESLKPTGKKYKVFDVDGLYIEVLPTGTLSWRYNYKHHGKNQTKTYGNYPAVSLAEARRLHLNFTPSEVKKHTFDELKEVWLAHKLPQIKSQGIKIQNRVDAYCKPLEGVAIADIKRADFVKVVQSLGDKSESAKRVGIYLNQMFNYAVDLGWIETHAASGLSRVIKSKRVEHLSCVSVDEAHTLMDDIRGYGYDITRIGLLLVANTFVRSNELRYMQWREVSLTDKVWVIPSERMKMGKAHVVPLSRQALALLEELRQINGSREFVFQSPLKLNQSISENTLLDGLYAIGYKGRMTVHGFRSLASTVLNQFSPFKSDVIERQLAHKERDDVRGAYNRAEYIDERIKLMQWYSDWLEIKPQPSYLQR